MPQELVFFPAEVIELNRELATGLHKPLEKLLSEFGSGDIADKLACIAAYCEIVVDGVYDGDQIAKLAGILYEKLQGKRVNPNATLFLN